MDIIDYVIQTGLTSCMPVLDKTSCYCQDRNFVPNHEEMYVCHNPLMPLIKTFL